jgi:hypothetical protein
MNQNHQHLEKLYKLSDPKRAALFEAARRIKKAQEILSEIPDVDVAAAIWHLRNRPGGVSKEKLESELVSYFALRRALDSLLAKGRIVMERDPDGEERYFATDRGTS